MINFVNVNAYYYYYYLNQGVLIRAWSFYSDKRSKVQCVITDIYMGDVITCNILIYHVLLHIVITHFLF